MAAFDAAQAWRLGSQVALRPEPFGALAYHFGTRRLSFLKSPALVDLVRSLDEHATAHDAVLASGLPDTEHPMYEQALARLADTGMIELQEAA